MDFDDAADELYGLPLDEFIATRNRLVKQAKKDAPDIADKVRELRKPTVAAWLANQLARHRPADVRTLLELGEELRTATAAMDGDRLRELTPRRHKTVDVLVKAARELSDKPVSQDVAQKLGETLDAALVDPSAAGALRSGRLTSALRHVGFGLVDESGEPSNVVSLATVRALREPAPRSRFEPSDDAEGADGAGRSDGARRTAGAKRSARAERSEPEPEAAPEPIRKPSAAERRRLREAEKAVAAAEEEAERIDAQAEALAEDLEERRERVKAAQAEVERLAAALEDARDAVAEARSEVRRITDELDDARQDARAARRRTREAQIELAKLTDS
jgi:uncharacterized protein YoxC